MAVPLWFLGVTVLVPSLTVLERPPLALELVHDLDLPFRIEHPGVQIDPIRLQRGHTLFWNLDVTLVHEQVLVHALNGV